MKAWGEGKDSGHRIGVAEKSVSHWGIKKSLLDFNVGYGVIFIMLGMGISLLGLFDLKG